MAGDKTKDLIWENLFLADARSRYFSRIAGELRKHDRILAIAVGFLSSGAAGTALASYPTVSLVLSLLTAVFAVMLSVFKLDKRVSMGASISREWAEVLSEYEIIFADLDGISDEEAIRKHRELEKKHRNTDQLAMEEFPLRLKLWEEVQAQTAAARGA